MTVQVALAQARALVATLEQMVGDGEVEVPGGEFVVYSQRDPAWAGDRLGPDEGGGTLGGAGCAVTCAAMVATSAGEVVTPGELNRWLSDNRGFFAAGPREARNLLEWERVADRYPVLAWEGQRSWRKEPADMEEVWRRLEWGPVVAEVDFDYSDWDVDQHFVVLLRWVKEDEIEIADPWDGKKVGLVERYFNPAWSAPAGMVARVITGLRLLRARM